MESRTDHHAHGAGTMAASFVDKQTKAFTTYLDFNGAGGRPGLFQKFTFERNLATGLINVVFDPQFRDQPITIDLRNAGFEDALQSVSTTTRMVMEVLPMRMVSA